MNDLGQIVGTYSDSAGNQHGFLLTAGNFTTIDFPGAVATVAGGINDHGQIVGNCDDASGINHGFLLSAGSFTTVDFPGALDTTAPFGISANGKIVGLYDDSNGESRDQFSLEHRDPSKRQAQQRASAQMLMTHPGVGSVTALATDVFLADPTRFVESNALANYVGMILRGYSSGERQRLGGLTKRGVRCCAFSRMSYCSCRTR
jgi:probable HAF family extracellular repeat protein